jgi:flagellar protein FlaG
MDIKNISNMMDKNLVQGQTVEPEKVQQLQRNPAENIKKENEEQLKKLDKNQLEELSKDINKKFEYLNKYLKIEIDNDLHEPIIKIMDKKTNEVIKQFPPEYLVELAKKIDELVGLLFSKEA